MSRVDELIKKLCPDGVVFEEIGAVVEIKNGKDWKTERPGKIPVFGSGGQMDVYVQEASCVGPSVLLPRKGSLAVQFVDAPFWNVDTVFYTKCNPEQLDIKYFYYVMERVDLSRISTSSTRPSITQTALKKLVIPVPPLEIQLEIARILDKFTQLEAELEAELEARRKQYAYYIEKLGADLRTKFSTTSLGDVGDWIGGNTPSKGNPKYWENGEILWVSSKDMKASRITTTKFRVTDRAISEGPARMVPKGAVLVVTRSSILERTLPVANLATEATINQDIKAIIPSGEFDHRYIYFAIKWSADEILRTIRKSGGSVTSLDTKKLKDFKIPAPPLEEQRQIVAILDKFDALVNDISTGLPAEIAARRKQYEYYRDKLLSFQPAAEAQQ